MARRILIVGDSLSIDPRAGTDRSWAQHLRDLTGAALGARGNVQIDGPWQVISIAKVDQTLALAAAQVANLPQGYFDTAVILLGRYDLALDAVSQATLRTRMTTLHTTLRAAGVRTILQCDLPPWGDLRYEVDRRQYNTWLASAGVDVVRIADRLGGSDRWRLGSAWDAGDDQNLTDEGNRALAGLVLGALLRMPEGPWYRPPGVPAVSDFVPTELSGCVLWLRADRGVTIAAGRVSAWADGSGRGNDVSQANAAKRPTMGQISGRPAVLFDPANPDDLSGPFSGLPANTGLTSYLVARITDLTVNYRCAHMFHDGTAATNGFQHYFYLPAAPPIPPSAMSAMAQGLDLGVPQSSQVGYAYADVANPHLWVFQHDVPGRSIMEDGAGKHSLLIDRVTPAIVAQRLGNHFLWDLPWSGEIAEMVVFDRVQTLDEQAAVANYVSNRYAGIVLP